MNVKTRRPSKHANKSRQTWSWEKKGASKRTGAGTYWTYTTNI